MRPEEFGILPGLYVYTIALRSFITCPRDARKLRLRRTIVPLPSDHLLCVPLKAFWQRRLASASTSVWFSASVREAIRT
jgi:hypothetical protein